MKSQPGKTNPNYKHGMKGTRYYRIWQNMKNRCRNENMPVYKFYGAKGIGYPKKWETFDGFYEDMFTGYSDNLTLDRIDGTKSYSKENCRWITQQEQKYNTKRNRNLTYSGKTQTMAEWSLELGLGRTTIAQRLDKLGWSVEKALSTPKI